MGLLDSLLGGSSQEAPGISPPSTTLPALSARPNLSLFGEVRRSDGEYDPGGYLYEIGKRKLKSSMLGTDYVPSYSKFDDGPTFEQQLRDTKTEQFQESATIGSLKDDEKEFEEAMQTEDDGTPEDYAPAPRKTMLGGRRI